MKKITMVLTAIMVLMTMSIAAAQVPKTITFSPDPVSVTEGDSGNTTQTFTVTLNQSYTDDTAVLLSIVDIDTDGLDYVLPTDRVTIPAGSTTATFDVNIVGDTDIETDESFTVEGRIDVFVNGDIQKPFNAPNGAGGFSTLPGTTNPACNPVTTYAFERGQEGTYGGDSSNGNFIVEVDKLSQGHQTIVTIPGETYEVTFKASPRTAGGATTQSGTVTVLDGFSPNGTNVLNSLNVTRLRANGFNLEAESFTFVAASNACSLTFTTDNCSTTGIIMDDFSISGIAANASSTITITNDDVPPGPDTDGDGINDDVDVDDDNDGILDTVEFADTVNNLDFSALSNTGGAATTATNGNDITDVTAGSTNSNDANYTVAENGDGIIRYETSSGNNTDFIENTYTFDVSKAPILVADPQSAGFTGQQSNMNGSETVRYIALNPNPGFSWNVISQGATTTLTISTTNFTDDTLTVSGGTPGDFADYNVSTTSKVGGVAVRVEIVASVGAFDSTQLVISQSGVDTDDDGIFDQFDLDSDGDGIPDNFEAQTTANFTPFTGAVNGATDPNPGLGTGYGSGLTPVNVQSNYPLTDRDLKPDYLQLNSDGDSNGDDSTESGITAAGADTNNNGLDDGSEDLAVNTIGAAYTSPNGNIDATALSGNISTLGDLNFRVKQFDFTYLNGWVNNPEGYLLGNEDVLVREGTVTIDNTFVAKNLTIGTNTNGPSELILNVDVTVQGNIGLNTVASGDGYIIHDNTDATDVTLTVGSLDATLHNYRVADPQGVGVTEFIGFGGIPGTPAILNITGNLDLAGGGMTNSTAFGFGPVSEIKFVSTASGTAHISGDNVIDTGSTVITAERYLSGTRAFRFLSSPISGQTIANSWQQDIYITGTAGASDGSDSGTTGANGFDLTISGNPSMFTYDGTSWSAVPNTTSTTLQPGRAYRVLSRGDRNGTNAVSTLTDPLNNASSGEVTLSVEGNSSQLEQGTVVITGVDTFNQFIGNPYQAKVDLSKVTNLGNPGQTELGRAIYTWDVSAGTRGAYVTDAAGTQKVLEPGQGFFTFNSALILGTPSNFTFELDDRVSNTASGSSMFRSTSSTGYEDLRIKLYHQNRYAAGMSAHDEVVIQFNSTMNDGFDLYDAQDPGNLDENLAIVSNGYNLSVERRTLPTTDEIIPLRTSQYSNNNQLFEATLGDMGGMLVYLKDNYTNTLTQFPSNATTTYAFTIDPNVAASSAIDRFQLMYSTVTLSSADVAFGANFRAFPNPVTGDTISVIVGDLGTNNVQVSLFNTLGQEVYANDNAAISNGMLTLNELNDLSNGVYLLNITTSDSKATVRIIKE